MLLIFVLKLNIMQFNYVLNTNVMHKLLFIHIMLKFLYMFRAINVHLQEVVLYTCSLW
jgi:hypothetical protein